MADDEKKSKFIKWQDKNGDGLIDICVDEVKPAEKCPSCIPNPNAVVPKWKTRDRHSPWFNDKYCTYQITIKALEAPLLPGGADPETITEEEAAEHIESLFEKYKAHAAEHLLDAYNKSEAEDYFKQVTDNLEHTKYDLSVRPGSRVKLLYTIQFGLFDPIPEREETGPPKQEDEDAPITITYNANNINAKLLKFRKAMYMYSRYYRVFQSLEGGTFVFEKSGKAFTKSQFDRYGDLGFFLGASRSKDLLSDLDNWLNDRGMNIFGVGTGWGWFRERVVKIKFYISAERKRKC